MNNQIIWDLHQFIVHCLIPLDPYPPCLILEIPRFQFPTSMPRYTQKMGQGGFKRKGIQKKINQFSQQVKLESFSLGILI